jgi:putative transposase
LFQQIAAHQGFEIEELEVDKGSCACVSEFPSEVLDWESGGAVQGGQRERDSEEYPEVRKQLWGEEFGEDGHFVRTAGDEVTAEMIKKYIRFHEARKRGAEQSGLF